MDATQSKDLVGRTAQKPQSRGARVVHIVGRVGESVVVKQFYSGWVTLFSLPRRMGIRCGSVATREISAFGPLIFEQTHADHRDHWNKETRDLE